MSVHKKSDSKARKEKYTAQFGRTERNKQRNKAKMLEQNPNYPNKKRSN